MANFTKGEWEVNGNKVDVFHTGTVALCPSPQNGGTISFIANANLIAAAPDMYEALRDLTFQFAAAVESPYSKDKEVYEKANKALAKAQGK